jgi:hypothetical protein
MSVEAKQLRWYRASTVQVQGLRLAIGAVALAWAAVAIARS